MRLLIFFIPFFLYSYEIKWIKTTNSCYFAFPIVFLKNIEKIEYNGKCINQKVNGNKITICFKDGKIAKYIGEIKNGYFEGLGKLKYNNGSFIAGFWKKSYPVGTFNMKLNNKGYYQCVFDGVLNCEGAAAKFGRSREKASARWVGDYVQNVAKATKEMLTSSSKNSSSTSGDIKLEYEGYTDWNKHYTYDVSINDKYDGQIFYYRKDSGYQIMTIGTSHSINGFYSPKIGINNLYTPKCGDYSVNSIEEAIKRAINCAYKGHY